ncbi:hypothetical protein L1049_019795 [Liquidambar formosana]|uniref:Low-temperature-induced 65 kDa protein n=1 Tax=Liquidambar formosana TaxID=63359 RepID=A0AAP0SC59_LIQFO
MDSHIANPHGHNDEEDPHTGVHSVVEGEDEHHHEKKSVLKKVKAKAKKIKDTLTKHGHGHGDDHDEHGHDHDFDEEDDEDEEMVEDPEVHGAPMYDSAAKRGPGPGQEENLGQHRVHLVRSSVLEEAPHAPVNTPASFSPGISETRVNDRTKNFDHGQEENQGQHRGYLGRSTVLKEDPHAPKDRPEAHTPANYQTKVTDPTGAGGKEAGITPILRSFGKMSVYDEPEPKTKHILPTGSHDQFSPEFARPTKIKSPEDPQPITENLDATKPKDQPHDENKTETPSSQSSYTEKLSSATSVIADKAISAKNVVASKLGYGGAPEMHEGGDNAAKSSQGGEQRRTIAATVTEKLSPVYDKVAEAGSTVMSKMHRTGTGTGKGTGTEGGVKGPDKGVSVKEFFVEKLRPGDEDRALSEVISDVLRKRKEEDEAKKESRPMGKVTESERVAKRLGTGDENSRQRVDPGDVRVCGNVSPGTGVVDRLKGAVSSWLSKGGESQTSQASLGSSYAGAEGGGGEVGHGNDVVGERRLQESSD